MDEKSLRILEFDKIRQRLIDLTSFPPGRELAQGHRPTTELDQAQLWLTETEEAVRLISTGTGLSLSGAGDLRPFLPRAAAGASLAAEELLLVAQTLRVTRRLQGHLEEKADLVPQLAALGRALRVPDGLEEEIFRCLDEEGMVKDEASPELGRLRREKKTLLGRLRDKLDALLHSPEIRPYLQEVLITQRGDRYVVPVKQEFKNMVPGLIHDQSASGATVFIEPMAVVELNNALRQVELKEREEIRRILLRLSGLVGSHGHDLAHDMEVLGKIDLIAARGRLALEMRASRPHLQAGGWLELHRARHPLLRGEVVPIDVELGRSFRTLVITGPNTGGKTVTLKTIGLLTLMAQAGFFIPAEAPSRLPVFGQVFADIGDEQSIEQSLSTFSSHMVNLVRIVEAAATGGQSADQEPGRFLNDQMGRSAVWRLDRSADDEPDRCANGETERSADDEPGRTGAAGASGKSSRSGLTLALLDELGAGTDPTEGAALAMAILEFLHAHGVWTVATTHYSELKTFAYSRPGVKNASVEFDSLTLRPTYRLIVGLPGRSNAFEISQRLGLRREVIERARQFLTQEEIKVEDLLAQIERDRAAAERERQEMSRLKEEAARLKAQYEERWKELREKEKAILEKARWESREVLRRAKAELKEIIENVRRETQEGEAREKERAITRAREGLARLAEKVGAEAEVVAPAPTSLPLTTVSPGQPVYVTSLELEGRVLAAPEGEEVLVQAGLLKVKVKLGDLRAVREEKIVLPKGDNASRLGTGKALEISTELDLRGLTAAEAIEKTDKFLDDAFLAGAAKVRLIHGKGTGALRRAISEFLRNHPHVRSQRLGLYGEGGEGVTIVELR